MLRIETYQELIDNRDRLIDYISANAYRLSIGELKSIIIELLYAIETRDDANYKTLIDAMFNYLHDYDI